VVPTPIYRLSDDYIEHLAELDPIQATIRGLLGHDREMTDYSPEGIEARSELARATLAELSRLTPDNDRDRVAAEFLAERLQVDVSSDEAGEALGELRIVGSRFQLVRMVFDVMPRATDADWTTIATRLEGVPNALAGIRSSLAESVTRGSAPARRQVLACAQQAATWSEGTGSGHTGSGHTGSAGARNPPFFADLVAQYGGDSTALGRRLETGARRATDAYGSIGAWLRDDFAVMAPARDPVGRERYTRAARNSLGTTLDLDETYLWAWEELHRLEAEMSAVAHQILPGATVPEVIAMLESDAGRAIHGADNLRSFLQDLMDRTIAELDGTHFDIPGPLKTVEAMIAPPGTAAAMYYTGPAEDFSRPGRTWYPTGGKTVFPLWGEVSICYHEGVPGHHLQIGQVKYLKEQLNRFQRTATVSGHVEGWALYAERLMEELGYFENPEYRLGYLRAQVMRAVRVVVDIGMHLEMAIPADERFHPGETWSPELGQAFLFERSCFPPAFMASELDRYLGWPGQAICYKIGERVWLAARRDAERREGATFNLKAFHAHALGLGNLGLDQLAAECAAGTDLGPAGESAAPSEHGPASGAPR
jgi:uncharacterized protein (DUF885 family)